MGWVWGGGGGGGRAEQTSRGVCERNVGSAFRTARASVDRLIVFGFDFRILRRGVTEQRTVSPRAAFVPGGPGYSRQRADHPSNYSISAATALDGFS